MSCCGGNCGCGAGCKCGNGCGGCKMYPDMSFSETTATIETFVVGVAPEKMHFEAAEVAGAENGCKCGNGCGGCKMYPDMSFSETTATIETFVVGVAPEKMHFEAAEVVAGAENGCKCGDNCTCNPCNCK